MATPEAVLSLVSALSRVTVDVLLSPSRAGTVSQLRSAAVHLLRTEVGLSAKQAGQIVGRNRASVLDLSPLVARGQSAGELVASVKLSVVSTSTWTSGQRCLMRWGAMTLSRRGMRTSINTTPGLELGRHGRGLIVDDKVRVIAAHGLSLVPARQHRLSLQGRRLAALIRRVPRVAPRCRGCIAEKYVRGELAIHAHVAQARCLPNGLGELNANHTPLLFFLQLAGRRRRL